MINDRAYRRLLKMPQRNQASPLSVSYLSEVVSIAFISGIVVRCYVVTILFITNEMESGHVRVSTVT